MLFAMICGFGEVEDVPDLWGAASSFTLDFVHRYSEQTGPHFMHLQILRLLTSTTISPKTASTGCRFACRVFWRERT
ncbi:hypothetical protein AVEN_46064-1 [Araneus ventricosus]|uniref:Uncharacterized protein n=1 Tax=Araneus ventricosus TaxID=182803 RepID=A0A4Y2R5B0_ARAVE|nr:hypothetical protein AVEN_46064-1 [Araneus ventricosus]